MRVSLISLARLLQTQCFELCLLFVVQLAIEGWRIDYFDLTLLSVRNLSNIAHTRACIALN
jgi:hypothetical protein